jgi:RNA polymerase sigma factor (sigma-70 family)
MHDATDRLLKLLAEHGGRLHLLLVRLTLREEVAEDLLQDLFLRLCRSDGMLGATRPEKYLFRTAVNLAFEWRRKNGSARKTVGLAESTAVSSDQPPKTVLKQEEVQRVLAAMDRLSARSRELLTLRYLEGLSYDEMATLLNSTPHRIRARCSKAAAQLRKRVSSD